MSDTLRAENWVYNTLWSELKQNKFVVPRFQRKFVWDSSDICKLVDSIYKKLPIGSFLFWETMDEENKKIFLSPSTVLS